MLNEVKHLVVTSQARWTQQNDEVPRSSESHSVMERSGAERAAWKP